MSLSKDLISQFVKATKDTTTVKKESTVYGTVVKYNKKTYVKIDGSDLLTPAETLSSVEEGERVSIMIKDHTATITGNYTAPSASSIKVDGMDADLKANTADIKNLVAKNAEIENLVATKATIEDLQAANAEIDTLKADYAEIETLVADKASIGDLAAVNADIKSLKADKADIAHLEANYATIGSLNAVYADVTRLEADKANIKDLEANYATIESLEANYATIKQLDAANANITNLQTETANINTALIDKANVSDLAAANAVIDDLKAGKADIADLTAANAKIANLEANKADISVLEANYATIKQLDATNANVTNLQTETANINKALIDKADVSDLNATNANVTNLQATKANVSDLNATNANVNTLTGNLADITTLVNGNLTSDNIQSMVITGDKFTVEDGFIKNAMIDSVNANKINTGVINTNNVKIQSNDGSMLLQGNLQQFKDKNGKVRIQIGKDATGNFTFVLYDENGTGQLINQNGIQSSNAIADGLIVDSKVADNANIAGSKLDIDSVVTEVNNGTTSIKGTKIYLDDQKQSLNVAFNNMSTTVKGNTNTIQSHTTSINTMNGKVTQLISDTTITKQDGTTTSLKDAYNATVDTVDNHSTKIGSLETNLATANNNISSVSSKQSALEQNLNGFKQTVSQTYATKTSVTDVSNNLKNNYSTTSAMNSAINQKANEITSSVSQTYATKTSVTDISNNLKNNYSTTSAMNTAINQKADSILSTVSKTYATQTSVTDVSNNLKNNYSTTSAMNSAINQKANEITSSVSETYATKTSLKATDDKFANYSTTSQMNTAIKQKSDAILSTVSQTYTTKADFNNLTVGGTNLLLNSKDYNNEAWTNDRATITSDIYMGTKVYKTRGTAWSTIAYKINDLFSRKIIELNTDYTFSAYVKSSASTYTPNINFYGHADFHTHSNTKVGTANTSWQKVSITFKFKSINSCGTDKSHCIRFEPTTASSNGEYIMVCGMKLEKGNRATGWSPAPEDADKSISTVDGKFASYSTTSQMNSAINQKANEITSTVSKTYATKTSVTDVSNNLKNNYSTTSAMNSAINQKADAILSTVSSTYATKTALKTTDDKFANYSTTSQMNSAINQKSDSILSTVSNTYTTKADFNGLTIGGRNFLVRTKNAFTKAINTTEYTTNDPYTTYNSQTLSSLGFKVGDKITVSFDWSLSNVTTAGNFRVETVQDSSYKSLISGPHNFGSATSGRYVGTKTLESSDVNINKIRIRVDASNLTITIKNMKLEKGNKDTSWSPAPEDIDSAISNVDNKFANYSTTSQMNSAINQKANEITSSVSQTYATKTALNTVDGKFANYSTTSAMNTAINQKANEITSSVSNTYTTKTEFGNLRVGGTNLVKNSKLFGSIISNPGGWAIRNTGSEGYKKLFIETTSTDWKEIYIPLYSAINSLKDKITISFDYTETKSGLLGVSFGVFTSTGRLKELENTQASTLKVIGNPDGWKRVSYTIDPTSLLNQSNATQYGLQFKKWSTLTGSIQIKKVQAEIGTIATEWNPAPQDTEGSISSLTTRMNNAESKLTKDSLTTIIGSYYTTSNDVNGLITSKGYATTSQVSQTATDLTAKFSSSGGYNLLRNSIFTRNGEYWAIDSTYTTIDTSRTFNGHNSLKINSTGATSDVWRGPKQRFAENIPSGKTYTASLWYYVADKNTFNSEFRLELKGKKTGASGESAIADTMIAASNLVQGAWTKVTVTATTRESWEYLFIYPWVKRNGTIWITELQVEEGPLATLWSPHPSEIYDGITQINKDGIKVYHSNINGENYTHMASSGFYIKNKGVDIFKVDSNGLYVKGNGEFTGKITSTSGAIGGFNISEYNIKGTNVGMGCSSGHDYAFWAGASTGGSAPFRVGHDGSLVATQATITGNVTIKGGSVPSTILTGTIDNARLNSTIVNGATNGTSAKSTLDSKASGWDSAKSTVDNNKTNWSNAYNRVVQWASGSVTGNTTINGGLIQTGTVTAKQLYLGDLTNYCNLREETASLYGFTSESSSWGTWYKLNNNQRDICISGNKVNDYGYYKCMGGESFRIKFEVKSNVKGSSTNGGSDSVYCGVNIGLYGKLGDGNNFYQIPSSGYTGDANSTEGHINVWTTLPSNARTFGVFLQLSGWGNWSGTCRIKNVQVFRMSSGELIVDGSITADKIAANAITSNKLSADAITGKTITGGTINGSVINGSTVNSDSFVGDMLAVDGAISAKSLQVQDIDSAKYPATLDGNVDIYVNSSTGDDDAEIDDNVRFKTIQGAIDAIPKFLNNKTVYITMETDSTEDVYIRGIVGGAIRVYMNGKSLYGTFRTYACAATTNTYGGTKSNPEGATGIIHPNVGLSFGGRAVSVGYEASQYAALYNIKVYAPDNLPSGVTNTDKVCVASQSGTGSVYCRNVQIVNAVIGFRTNNAGTMHVSSSSGVASKYGFQAATGGIISIANNNQAGGKKSSTNKNGGGQIWYDANGPTFATGNQSTDGGTAPVVSTTKTITIKSSYGDTYRSSVYNNWKKDGTVRQGDWGYGDSNGCWFFGSAFTEVQGTTIKKVTIRINRQSGGNPSAVDLVIKSHGYSSRPSGKPSYRTTAGTVSVAPGKSGLLLITNSTILSEISSGKVKGFGIQSTYDSSHYAVCSGSVTVKIEYQE